MPRTKSKHSLPAETSRITVRRVSLGELRPDPRNPRTHEGNVDAIPGFDGYGASRDGRIWTRILPGPARHLGDTWREISQWKAGPTRAYWYVQLFVCSRQTKVGVHRLMLRTYRGEPGPDQQTRHLNRDSTDNRIENLAWGTTAENTTDKFRHGTVARGFQLPQTRFTDEQRAQFVSDRLNGMKWSEIGTKYGVHRITVRNVVVRLTKSAVDRTAAQSMP